MDDFFLKFINLLCGRCTVGHHNTNNGSGMIFKYLILKKKVPQEYYQNYFNDVEHGFFHAFCCCYILYIIKGKLDPQTVASLLLHDFLKCNNFKQEDHDKELVNYFDNLLPETYIHSNPPEEFQNSIIILCDRIELRRYSDYKDWVDDRFYKIFDKFTKEQNKQINHFYSNTRPILSYFYENRDDTFLRHGIEEVPHFCNVKNLPNNRYPYISTYTKIKKSKDSYCIEIDNLPFVGPKGHCSSHDDWIWNRIKGYLSLKDFINKNGQIHVSNIRDHFNAKSNIKTKEWKFLVNYDYPKYNKNNKPQRKNMNKILNILKKNNIPIVNQKFVVELHSCYNMLKNRLISCSYTDQSK
jgi:hypothetical protein